MSDARFEPGTKKKDPRVLFAPITVAAIARSRHAVNWWCHDHDGWTHRHWNATLARAFAGTLAGAFAAALARVFARTFARSLAPALAAATAALATATTADFQHLFNIQYTHGFLQKICAPEHAGTDEYEHPRFTLKQLVTSAWALQSNEFAYPSDAHQMRNMHRISQKGPEMIGTAPESATPVR